jgi:glycosyltransferase involved in cell wall biosynthesis
LARATSLPEVGADAALYFTPGDPNELAAVMSELLKDDHARQELRAAGLERARQFTWRKSAEQTAEVYHSLLR